MTLTELQGWMDALAQLHGKKPARASSTIKSRRNHKKRTR